MKKFSIKALVAVVLILVLALALVACNKCTDGHTNADEDRKCDVCGEEIPVCAEHTDANGNKKCDVCGSLIRGGSGEAAAFFQNLWDSAAPIGGTEVADTDDLAVSMDMSIALGNGGSVLADLGVNIGLVLDRTPEEGEDQICDLCGRKLADECYLPQHDFVNNEGICGTCGFSKAIHDAASHEYVDKETVGKHSAAKISVYDHEHNENILTIFYFLDDNKNFYIDALGQSFKMAVDYNYNDEAATFINEVINSNLGVVLGDTVAGMPNVATTTVMGIINNLVDDFGANWNLDSPINAITGLLGVNIGELLEENTELLGTVNSVLKRLATSMKIVGYEGIDTDALAESDAVILDLLKGVGPILFPNVETEKNGNATTYKTGLDLTEKGLLGSVSFLTQNLPMGLGQLINKMEEVSLQYTTIDNVIDNFGINVSLGTPDDSIDLAIRINDMAISGVNASNAPAVLGANKANYKDYFEFGSSLDITISEDALVVTLEGEEPMDFKGTYAMELRGALDLMNVENNATRIYATMKHNNEEIARLTFDGSALALAVDSSSPVVKFIVEEGVSLLLQNLAFATDVTGQPDEWLRGFVLALANVAFEGTYADAAALKAATDFTINPALTIDKGVAITNINLADLKLHGAKILGDLGGMLGGLLGGSSASADTDLDIDSFVEQAWQPNIYKLLGLISEAVDGNIKTGLNVEIENIGELIVSLFATTKDGQTGPLTIDELCYGNLDNGIVGLFTMLDGEDWNAKDFANAVFGDCAWAGEDVLVSLMKSGIAVSVKSDLSGSIVITNGTSSISIAFSASIKASANAIDWTNVTFPDLNGWATYPLVAPQAE